MTCSRGARGCDVPWGPGGPRPAQTATSGAVLSQLLGTPRGSLSRVSAWASRPLPTPFPVAVSSDASGWVSTGTPRPLDQTEPAASSRRLQPSEPGVRGTSCAAVHVAGQLRGTAVPDSRDRRAGVGNLHRVAVTPAGPRSRPLGEGRGLVSSGAGWRDLQVVLFLLFRKVALSYRAFILARKHGWSI